MGICDSVKKLKEDDLKKELERKPSNYNSPRSTFDQSKTTQTERTKYAPGEHLNCQGSLSE